jgi:hypothetical protein
MWGGSSKEQQKSHVSRRICGAVIGGCPNQGVDSGFALMRVSLVLDREET